MAPGRPSAFAGEYRKLRHTGPRRFAAMLGATVQSKRSPETGDLSLQVSMVAGGRNAGDRYLRIRLPRRVLASRRVA